MDPDQVRRFYDDFMRSRMVGYRLEPNLRLAKAIERVRPWIRDGSRVLDVGCGIGIVSEQIAKVARHGEVVGIDVSAENIWYARKTITLPNVRFLQADVLMQFHVVQGALSGPVDVVTLIDVIEHIPAEARTTLLQNLRKLMKPTAMLVITYPSPQYQRYLKSHEPEELQIIDNTIEIHDLLHEGRATGFEPFHYSLETVWRTTQYVHCVFGATAPRVDIVGLPTLQRIGSRVRRALRRVFLVPFLRRKYVARVFLDR
jgi:trans-aconitate 2-methyltransferase